MKKPLIAVAGALLLGAGACQDNPSAPNSDRVVAGSPQTLQSLVTGFAAEFRTATAGSYFTFGAYMARDAMYPDPSDTRRLTEFYETPPDPSDFIGAAQWNGYYAALRAGHTILTDASLARLSPGDQSATRGFVHVVEAMSYLHLVEYRDELGVAIQGDDPNVVPPLRTKQAVLAYTSALLDTAVTELTAAGSREVPFTLPHGYTDHGDYASTANLLRLAQGLEGKAEVLRATDQTAPNTASAAAAITALDAALSDAPGTPDSAYLAKGPYFEYQPNAPETFANPVADKKIMLTDNLVTSIESGDARAALIEPTDVQQATIYRASYRAVQTDPDVASNSSAEIPMIRNAELYLLRAQAEIVAGDLAAATRDVNVVHTVEGKLPALPTFTSVSEAQDAVLYEYRYSFILQGPQHLVALRSYGRINAAYVSQPGIPTPGAASDALVQTLPIPKTEADARKGDVTPKP